MNAAPSDDTMRLQRLTADYASDRLANRRAIATLPAVVTAVRRVVTDQQEALRRRLEAERTRGLTRSVLVLDDDPAQRRIMQTALSTMLSVPVYAAGDVAEARRLYDRYKPAVVVVDLILQGGDTGDTFILDLGRKPRAVLVSGASDSLTHQRAATDCNAVQLSRADLDKLPEIVRGLLDTVRPPLWCRASKDDILSVSSDLADLIGYDVADLSGIGWRTIVHPDDMARAEAATRDGMGNGVVGVVVRWRCADGSCVALAWDVAPLTDGVMYAVARVV